MHFPDNVLRALKKAVVNVFWTKNDLRALFRRCDIPNQLVNDQDWSAYKFFIVDPVFDALNESPEGLGPLRRILVETLRYTDGNHLLRYSDGQKRKREAEESLEHLRVLVEKHDSTLDVERKEQERRRLADEERAGKQSFVQRREELRARFLTLHAELNRQTSGYGLEDLLYQVFDLFELQPRGPFKLAGEQIDGAFVHDGTDFLLEAKWHKEPTNLEQLRDLDGAVSSNLDNTLGLFISVNGFTTQALDRYGHGNRPRLVGMDGADLMAVLDGRIDLSDLLRRKRATASQRGKIFTPVAKIMLGEL
jgi:restriction endonuclease